MDTNNKEVKVASFLVDQIEEYRKALEETAEMLEEVLDEYQGLALKYEILMDTLSEKNEVAELKLKIKELKESLALAEELMEFSEKNE